MNILFKAALTIIVLLTSGCQSTHFLPNDAEQVNLIQEYQYPHTPSEEKALVYVVRPNILFGLVRFNVYLDSKDEASEMGYNNSNEYVYFEVEPGKHTIYSHSSTWYEKDIDVKAGETIVLEQQQGAFATHQLISLSESASKFRIMKASLGTIMKRTE